MNVVFFSGGVDSLTTVLMLKNMSLKFLPVYYDLGHKYANVEMVTVDRLAIYLGLQYKLIDLKGIGRFEKRNAEIPWRNDLLVMAAAMFSPEKIYISVEEGTQVNESKDRSDEFMEDIQGYLIQRGSKIEIENLVRNMTKQDEVEWIVKNCGDGGIDLVMDTFSCYTPMVSGKMCGECKACVRWFLAVYGARALKFMEKFEVNPTKSEVFKDYIIDTGRGIYGEKRGGQYKEVFQRLGFKL